MLGINGSEFIVLLAVAAVVLGPERLPQYTQQLTRLIRELRRMAQGAQEKVREELGPDFDDIDWRKLDPRQYDPRRIVRDALSDAVDLDDPLGLRGNSLGFRGDAGGAGGARGAGAPRGGPEPDRGTGRPVSMQKKGDVDPGGSDPLFDPDAT